MSKDTTSDAVFKFLGALVVLVVRLFATIGGCWFLIEKIFS